MDFRGCFKLKSSRLTFPTTILTPQLENYDIFYGYRESELPKPMPSEEDQPFMLAFNLASVMESELKITRTNKTKSQILQVEVVHMRREAEGVHPFARDCTYKFILPVDLRDKHLTALWTFDHHLIIVESSNFIEALTAVEETEEPMDVDTQVEEGAISAIKPRKVNCVFKPTVNIDVLRQSVSLSEMGLFNAKRIIQNGSFACPDIGRPHEKTEKYTVEKEREVVPYEGFFLHGLHKVLKDRAAAISREQEKVMKEKAAGIAREQDTAAGIAREQDTAAGIAREQDKAAEIAREQDKAAEIARKQGTAAEMVPYEGLFLRGIYKVMAEREAEIAREQDKAAKIAREQDTAAEIAREQDMETEIASEQDKETEITREQETAAEIARK